MNGNLNKPGDEISDEIKAVLIADIHQLRSELASIGEEIRELAPTITEVETKWFESKRQMLSTEFQQLVKQTLAEESRSALSEPNRMLAKASDSVCAATTTIDKANTRLLVMACIVGVVTGVCSAIISALLFL